MKIIKDVFRTIVFPLTIAFKVDKLILSRSSKNCCIVNFHGVRKNNLEKFNNRHLDVNEFDKIIRYLKKNFDVVPLSELFDLHRKKKKRPKRTIALTFDDGYENNFSLALPTLQKYNVPATYYIISKGLTDNNFYSWPDKLDIYKAYVKKDINVEGNKFEFPNYFNETLGLDILEYYKRSGGKVEQLVSSLFKNEDEFKQHISSMPELIELIRNEAFLNYQNESLIEFGSHTHTHPILEHVSEQEVMEELKVSKEILEKITNKRIQSLAFPDGSYDAHTIEIATELGYTDLVAVDYKFNENNANSNLLSRFTISNSTTFESNVLRLAKDFDKYGFN